MAPFRPLPEGLRLELRVTPGARKDAVEGLQPTAEGGEALKVKVTAPPEDGRANAAVIALLAKRWRLPKSAFTLLRGERDRNKSLLIAGDPAELAALLSRDLDERSG